MFNVLKNHNEVIVKAKTLHDAKIAIAENVKRGKKRGVFQFTNISKSKDSAVCQAHNGKVTVYSILEA